MIDHALMHYEPLFLCGIAAWAMFAIYWDKVAKSAAADKSSESQASRAVHVLLANAGLMLTAAPIRGIGRFLPVSAPIMAAGLAVELFGLFFAIWARRHLGANWSGKITIKVEHQLIRSGPYRRLRHPIYTGILAMYGGLAIVTGEWLAVIGFAMVLFAYWRKIRLEEANLRTAFGGEYEAYARETWALIPSVF